MRQPLWNSKHHGPKQKSPLSTSTCQMLTLQAELSTAQAKLQELQDDMADLRKALQDSQSRLRDREAENALIKKDLEVTRCRLLDSEREKSELALLALQRLEEVQKLNRYRVAQSRNSSGASTKMSISASEPPMTKQRFDQFEQRWDPPESSADRVNQYLLSLDQPEPAERHVKFSERSEPKENVCLAAERENQQEHRHMDSMTSSAACHQSSDTISSCSQSKHLVNPHLDQSNRFGSDAAHSSGRQLVKEQAPPLKPSLSRCDVESASDEVAFRDGLAALDASIESLQRTIKMDLGR
ncbi:hypothetical protein LDENG_00194120 [Lucifuga dentata]|nr:hypothetical protein LDENG_00194120 [Lucifuga dentata]